MLLYPYRKGTSFSQLTLYRYAATMLLYHGLHIEQSQPIAFHIVQITRGYAVEFVEDVLLLLGSNTDTVVADGDFGLFILPFDGYLAAMDGHFGFSVRIFDGVVYQVADDVAEMRTVGKYAQIFRFDVHRYVELSAFSLCCSMSVSRISRIANSSGCRRKVLRRSILMESICSTSPLRR